MNMCSIIKNLAGAILLCSIPVTAYAAHLSPQQAMARVQSSRTIHKLPGNQSLVLAHTEKANGESCLYVFNRGTNGFIVASADDNMPAVLGYSDNGAFDTAEASPELKWWLEQYAAQAGSYLSSGIVPVKAAPSSETQREPVPELMQTRWDQREPYNTYCPTIGHTQCVTGCVATAMAQVIKYHGYPATGSGQHSYNWNGGTLEYDYSAALFDYAEMLDSYYASATDAQKSAVGNLMYACGIGVDMDYGLNGSGAPSLAIPYALTEYFNYDKSIRYLKRDYYTAEEWDNIVYEEVAAGRPVIYGGQTGDGGHEFVCDGYQDGYFHINWGWSGSGNGWFLLSALDPGIQGVGGFEGGYNFNQDIICGIQPDAGNPQTTYPIFATGGLEVGAISSLLGNKYVPLTILNRGIQNYSPVEFSTKICLKAVSSTGEETLANSAVNMTFRGAIGNLTLGYSSISRIQLPKVGQGQYAVYLMYYGPQNEWLPVPMPITAVDHLDLNVDANGEYSFSKVDPVEKAKIKVTELSPVSEVISNVDTDFTFSIENIGDYTYTGNFSISVFKPDSLDDAKANNIIRVADLYPGKKIPNAMVNIAYPLEEGVYVQRCYDMYGDPCSKYFTLVIGHPAGVATGIDLDIDELVLTEGETFTITASVSGDDAADKTVTWTSSDPAVATIDGGMLKAIAPGSATITAATANGLTASCDVTIEARVIDVASISLDITEKTIAEGQSFTLTATVDPENATDKTVTWVSSDPAVAIVEDGVVAALAPGSAVITATAANGMTAACAVTVTPRILATSITLDQQSIEAPVGTIVKLIATVLPDDTTDKTVTWTSSNSSIATVDEEGNVTIVTDGTATITASTTDGSNLHAECIVTGQASITDIINESGHVDIYSPSGLLIRKDADAQYFESLAKGIYIIRSAGRAYKIMK